MNRLLRVSLVVAALLLPRALSAQDVTAGRSYHASLVSTVVARVHFTSNCNHFDVVNRGTTLQDVYLRFEDATDPVVRGDSSFVVAGNTMRLFATGNYNQPGDLTVRIISNAATPISVECRLE